MIRAGQMLALEKGDVVVSTIGALMYILILESPQHAEDPVCSRVLVLYVADGALLWRSGEVGLMARSALRNGNYRKFE